MLRLDPGQKLKLGEEDSIDHISTLTSLGTITELPTKSYVDSLHENSRNRRDLSSLLNNQDNEFDNDKLTNLDSVDRNLNSDNELANKTYDDDS